MSKTTAPVGVPSACSVSGRRHSRGQGHYLVAVEGDIPEEPGTRCADEPVPVEFAHDLELAERDLDHRAERDGASENPQRPLELARHEQTSGCSHL